MKNKLKNLINRFKKKDKEELKSEHEQIKDERRKVFANYLNELPQGENPRDFVRIHYSLSVSCPNSNYPRAIIEKAILGPYFLGEPIIPGEERKKDDGSVYFYLDHKDIHKVRYIKISDLPVSLDELIIDVDGFKKEIPTLDSCCGINALLRTSICSGDYGLLKPQARAKIEDIKKSKKILDSLLKLSSLYERLDKREISNALYNHYKNLLVNNQENPIERIRNLPFYNEKIQKKIFAEEFKRIEDYNFGIKHLSDKRDSELYNLHVELTGGSGGCRDKSALTEDTIKKLRQEIIDKYDPKIRELYSQIKSENWNEKVSSLEKLSRKVDKESSRSLTKKGYKTLDRVVRLVRRSSRKISENLTKKISEGE